MKEVIVLDFVYPDGDHLDHIYPVVIRDQNHTILVDCGPQDTLDILEDILRKYNVEPESLTHVFLTHHDQDHIGNLFALKEKYPDLVVMASEGEAAFISGERKLERLSAAEKLLSEIPKDEQEDWEAFIEVLKRLKPVAVDETVKPGDLIDACGEIRVLDTKGHTSHHVSLLLEHMDTLIAGDAAFLVDRKLVCGPDRYTINKEDAKVSLRKIKDRNVKNVVCYHGGLTSTQL